jgi:hypothetical protein
LIIFILLKKYISYCIIFVFCFACYVYYVIFFILPLLVVYIYVFICAYKYQRERGTNLSSLYNNKNKMHLKVEVNRLFPHIDDSDPTWTTYAASASFSLFLFLLYTYIDFLLNDILNFNKTTHTKKKSAKF